MSTGLGCGIVACNRFARFVKQWVTRQRIANFMANARNVVRLTIGPEIALPAVAAVFGPVSPLSIPVPEVAAAPPGVVVTEEVPDPSGVFIRSQ